MIDAELNSFRNNLHDVDISTHFRIANNAAKVEDWCVCVRVFFDSLFVLQRATCALAQLRANKELR
jgi:hypothetical protein